MAYYSALEPEKYHVCKNCTTGNNIEARNLREGKPEGARLCKDCAELQSKGECIPGMPKPAG